MCKRSFILAAVIAVLLLSPVIAQAQLANAAQFFAYDQVYPVGADSYMIWGPTGTPGSDVQRNAMVGITDFYGDHWFESGQAMDCGVGYDCLSHPYVSMGDGATQYQYIDLAWYFSTDGPYRFKAEFTSGQHTAFWLNGSTWQTIGEPKYTSYTSLPFAFTGYESLSNTKLDKPIYFYNAKYESYVWHDFCPSKFADQNNNGAVLIPCVSTAGSFTIRPGIRSWMPLQRRP